MFEAAAAHYLATGKRNFLDIALRNADLLVRTFGPGKREVAPGHEIVEMGLVRLYRITGKKDYLDLAKFFIDARGKRTYDRNNPDEWKNGEYWQDDKPVTEQDVAEGHAVRAMYLYSGMADVAALTGDKQYIEAIDRIWNDMAGKKIYVQGGIGAVPNGERFGDDYYLPNSTAYNETCAAIGDVFWNQRMFLLHGDSKYIDLLEKVLYNGMLSGVGLDGKSFFYTNAMQVRDDFNHAALERERSGWFECSCCPTNVLRLLPSIPGYLYATKGTDLYVNLFIASSANLTIGGRPIQIVQQNNYPWDGRLSFTLNPATPQTVSLRIRIPGWARGQAMPTDLYSFKPDEAAPAPVEIRINGKPEQYSIENGYAILSREWNPGDEIIMNLPMPVRKVAAISQVIDDHNQVAIQRGPLMYCAEWKDNADKPGKMRLMGEDHFLPANRPDLLGGITVLNGIGAVAVENIEGEGPGRLYRDIPLTLIPYYAWANRGKGEMTVWFPSK
jgi:uncharacterized protein